MTREDTQKPNTALVLPGGGARGAFQVGVLKALAELMPKGSSNPFEVISGTSAGAINSVVLASKARRFRVAAAELERVWANFHCEQVFRTDNWTMLKSSLHWMASIVLGGFLVGAPKSLLDNSPLRALLSRNVRFPRIEDAIDCGFLGAVVVTAASYFIGAFNIVLSGRTQAQGLVANATRRYSGEPASRSFNGEYCRAHDFPAAVAARRVLRRWSNEAGNSVELRNTPWSGSHFGGGCSRRDGRQSGGSVFAAVTSQLRADCRLYARHPVHGRFVFGPGAHDSY